MSATQTSENSAAGAPAGNPGQGTETSETSRANGAAASSGNGQDHGQAPGQNGSQAGGERGTESNTQPDGESKHESSDPAERARERAEARRQAVQRQTSQQTSESTSEQAAGDGDSTQTGSDSETPGEQAAGNGDSTQSGESKTATDEGDTTSGDEAGSDSTVAPPENWPQELRERFEQLPQEGEARKIVLDTYKDLQRGFTKGQQQLAQERKQIGNLVDLNNRFQQEPQNVLQDLAKQAGVQVWFEQPPPKGEMPEFKDANDMAEYVEQRVEERLNEKASTKEEQQRQQQAEQQAEQQLRQEIEAAKTNNSDWQKIQSDVFAKLRENPGMAVEHAVELVRAPQLRGELNRLRQLEQENAQLKAEKEQRDKLATSVHRGAGGDVKSGNEESSNDPAERARARAERRLGGSRLQA